ncbi:uncharacterized protein LOC143449994 isoform X1 [Clavelina lepadiformis]|uniref:uncharacterized protein LOC143449994 isoform X1 n=1 Tax=Clavelina lepadiformis TaxID=159417 RepID=UPI0040413D1A
MFDDHVSNCKRNRMDIMDEYLTSIGLKRKPIPKDGSCLFRAFSEQLFSTQAYHLHVRESCMTYMKDHQQVFEHFVDDPFDDYLTRMSNPKEWADQIEISALSKMYTCDFYMYEQPGKEAKNVTDNGYKKKIYLCHSGQKHYDSVYSVEYFKSYGICQSIVYSVLFEKVLGMTRKEESKLVSTFRMLSSPHSKQNDDDKDDDPYNSESVCEPSIGTSEEGIMLHKQVGLAYKLPISLEFVRSLDPFVCRNVDYDFWITIKRKQQYIDFSVAEGMNYYIGDRCLITLNIYSKPLIGHVQEVSPDNGPITVFIEALGDRYTIAVKNVKPFDNASNGCRGDSWPYRWRRRSANEGNWGWRSGSNRKYSRNKSGSSGSNLFNEDLNLSSKCHLEFVGHQKKSKHPWSLGSTSQKNNSTNIKSNGARKSNDVYHSPRSKQYSKSCNGDKYQWMDCRSPSQMFGNLSINRSSFTEGSWHCSDDELSSMIAPYPPNCHGNGEWEGEVEGQDNQFNPPYAEMGYELPPDENYTEETSQNWDQDPQKASSRENSKMPVAPDNVLCQAEHEQQASVQHSQSDSRSSLQQMSESASSSGSNTTLQFNENDPTSPCLNPFETQTNVPTVSMGQDYFPISVVPEQAGNYAAAPCEPRYMPQPSPRPSYLPYNGTVTMFDAEGKEMPMADDKNPFQYFYNLGLEYYRQLNGGSRGVPVVMGATSPPPYNTMPHPPIMHSPVGYVPAVPNYPNYPQQVPSHGHNSGCVPLTHFHPAAMPPGGSIQPSIPPGRIYIHVPPPAMPQTPAYTAPQAVPSSDTNHHPEPYDPADNVSTSSNHMIMINREINHENVSNSRPITTGGFPSYPSSLPTYQGNAYVPQVYPQSGHPFYSFEAHDTDGGARGIPSRPPNGHCQKL